MAPLIQWYPGHIAKAEKQLLEQLKLVDVVLEVRDARIIASSQHPKMPTWTNGKAHLVICNRVDMIPESWRARWQNWFQANDQAAYFTDAQSGKGINEVMKATQIAGEHINQRRKGRGMLPRPVRAVVIGFPNVGKSALINRLLNKRVVASANRPGVTRQLRWVRISEKIELLDTPGVIPPLLNDQEAALRLAICDDIGQASYDSVLIAAAMLDLFNEKGINYQDRYHLDVSLAPTGIDYIHQLAQTKTYQGDQEKAARQILHDFRKGRLGAIALEAPPSQISVEIPPVNSSATPETTLTP
ncbi:MAG: ribosome biogenesis GTPase YlqF [Pseudanabaenaceae cyanobacterium]|jgi:ribosome biogenesis GTPase A